MPKIFVALSTFAKNGEEPLKRLKASGFDFEINPTGKRLTGEQVVEFAQNYDGVVAGLEPYDADVLKQLPNLKCISRCGVGIDNIDQEAAKEQGVAIRNTPDVVAQPVAELTLAMIFDLVRHLTWHTKKMNAQKWERQSGRLLNHQKVGLIGLGRIGRRVAEMLTALGVEVYGYDIMPDTTWAQKHGIRISSLDQCLQEVDIVSLHISPTPEAPFILGEEEISSMKDGALLINVSRGNLIDESALTQALTSGKLGGAGLDVYALEPYQGSLTKLDNVVLTPHIATLTKESRCQMETDAVRNCIEYFQTILETLLTKGDNL